ncbi:MAG TPA: hypothetical protein VJ969_11605, partial [Desulfopila sp.]|nr:hypothetical protein [Desulfopila sp.]
FNTRCLGGENDESVLAIEHCAEKLTNGYGFLQRSGTNTSAYPHQGSEYSFTHSWFQKVAYERIPPVRRNYFHRQAGQRLESLFKHDIEGVAPALALHFEKAGDLPKAIQYRNIAGQAALLLFSADNVVRHLSRGLQLMATLPEEFRRADQEIEMLVPLGSVLVATRGYAHPEVESVYERAHKLCRKTEHNAQLLPTLYGLSTYYMVRGDFGLCRELWTFFLETAKKSSLAANLAWGYSVGCMASWYQGRYMYSCELAEKGLKFYDPSSQQEYCRLFGMDAGLVCLLHHSLARWVMGYPLEAKKKMQQALDISEEHSGPLMRSFVLCFAGWLELFLKDYSRADRFADKSLTLAARNGIEYWNIQASFLQEYISGMTGRNSDVTQLLNGYIETHRQTGAVLIRGMFLYLLAECYLQRGDPASALESVELALETTRETGEDWWTSELLRFKGDLLLRLSPHHGKQMTEPAYEAEKLYLKAAALANEQSAKTLELRATTSLYILRAKTAREESARQRLGGVMATFTEGFDTLDFNLAKSLLENRGKVSDL